jgi:amino acid adenylation domain-containing protein
VTTTLDRRLDAWVERSPDAIAVEDSAESLTYAQLDALANRFARVLREAGVNRGDRVGIHAPRSGRVVAAMLGVLRAGAAYVPLDPASPPARLKLIVQDCALRHVVVAPASLSRWVAAGFGPAEQFLLLDDWAGPLPSGPRIRGWKDVQAASPERELSPVSTSLEQLAYILYTSGSTGVPKGVMLSHRNAAAFIDWAADAIDLRESDRVASVAPFHFDLSVFDIWASLSRGARIVVVDEVSVLSGRRMLDRIHDAAISVWYSVPSALVLMLESGGLSDRGAPSLRVVFFAGEVFPLKHLGATMRALPRARFFNLFGPTETNVCLAHELPGPPGDEVHAIPIGRPTCGDTVSVLDVEGRPVAAGGVGELFVDGPTLMMGYWDGGRGALANRPYATGDMVSQRPDGEFMYHGRRDHMVKIHGFRVELGEVEAALLAMPGVREAIVFAVDQRLVAGIVPSTVELSVLDVKRHCASRLPQYMVPGEVRLVAGLPRTSSGKTDRIRTRQALVEGDASVFAPATAKE